MYLYDKLKYGIWRVLEKLCLKFHVYAFVKTHSGLKNINTDCLFSNFVIDYNNNDIILVEPDKLFLGIDFLKDRYTLLDCCLLESPHYYLMQEINKGGNIKNSDYYNRFISGRLDGRHRQNPRRMTYFYEKYDKALQSIECGNYKPVVIYSWKDRYYIFDGKHRAALCALLKKDVRCILVSPENLPLSIPDFCQSAINKEIYRIIDGDNHFTKHINFLNNGKK